jgi:hypothetical protein
MASIDEQKKLVKLTCRKFRSLPWVPLAQKQRETSHDAPARGGVWISRTAFPTPASTSLRNALYSVINHLKSDYHRITPAEDTPLIDVGVEFIGIRSGVPNDAPEPAIAEEEKLQALEKECENDMTILYIHGGGL